MNEDLQIPIRQLGDKAISLEVLKYVPFDSAVFYQFIPLQIVNGVLEVGMVDPENPEARDALRFLTAKSNLPFKIFLISHDDFEKAMKGYSGMTGQVDQALDDLASDIKAAEDTVTKFTRSAGEQEEPTVVEEAPVTKIVSVILQHATSGLASDIHIEPTAKQLQVRFRVDGTLYPSLFLPLSVHEAIVARIKILCNMKLDEKRKPQDGRFSARIDARKVDFRVSTFPTYFGEKIVLRILDPERKLLSLESLGFSPDQIKLVREAIDRPYGMILLTGPTGSGKTTTLYAMLNEVNKNKNNVVSLEDPIEYDMPGISQSQVRPEIDYTFANGLRSILRQDPDVIMVGEMRDRETAKLAIQAALTGHLVFSTLHTNTAVGVIPRLIDMGVEPFLIAPTLVLAIGQRLVPVLCEDAKRAVPVEESIHLMIEKEVADLPEQYRRKFNVPQQVYEPGKSVSCPSGVKGRLGVFEFLRMDPGLEKIILKNPVENDIYRYVRDHGFTTMKEDAIAKAFRGIIPFGEVNKL